MAFQMPPHEVLERFTEGEMVNLIAYENLYGQLGPERLDTLVARLGMDVVAPHLKRGQKPKFEDHLITWGAGKKKKQKMSPQEMLAEAKAISKAYKAGHKPTRKKSTQQQGDQKPPGSKTTSGPSAIQRRRRRS